MSRQIFGYVRVSTPKQNEARQMAAIDNVDRLYIDKVMLDQR